MIIVNKECRLLFLVVVFLLLKCKVDVSILCHVYHSCRTFSSSTSKSGFAIINASAFKRPSPMLLRNQVFSRRSRLTLLSTDDVFTGSTARTRNIMWILGKRFHSIHHCYSVWPAHCGAIFSHSLDSMLAPIAEVPAQTLGSISGFQQEIAFKCFKYTLHFSLW